MPSPSAVGEGSLGIGGISALFLFFFFFFCSDLAVAPYEERRRGNVNHRGQEGAALGGGCLGALLRKEISKPHPSEAAHGAAAARLPARCGIFGAPIAIRASAAPGSLPLRGSRCSPCPALGPCSGPLLWVLLSQKEVFLRVCVMLGSV